MLIILGYLALLLGALALGGLAVDAVFKWHLKHADDRVARFEKQLKEQHRGKD